MNIKRHILNLVADFNRLGARIRRQDVCQHLSNYSDLVDLHIDHLVREGLLSLGADGESLMPTSLSRTIRQIKLRDGSGFVDTPSGEDLAAEGVIAVEVPFAGFDLDFDVYAQVVSDDSMADAGIYKGDIAVIQAGEPERGKIVAVEIAGEMVLRRFVLINTIPHLLAENRTCPDLKAWFEIPIHGVLFCTVSSKLKVRKNATAPPAVKVNYAMGGPLDYRPSFIELLDEEMMKDAQDKGTEGATQTNSSPKYRGGVWPKPVSGKLLQQGLGLCRDISGQAYRLNESPDHPYGGALAGVERESDVEQQKSKSPPVVASADEDGGAEASNQPPADFKAEVTTKNTHRRRERVFLRA